MRPLRKVFEKYSIFDSIYQNETNFLNQSYFIMFKKLNAFIGLQGNIKI
jgi:hypothetical protein